MMHEGNFFLLAPTSGPPTIMGPPHCGVCGGGSYATGHRVYHEFKYAKQSKLIRTPQKAIKMTC